MFRLTRFRFRFRTKVIKSAPTPPPPVAGALSHTLLQIGLTTPAA